MMSPGGHVPLTMGDKVVGKIKIDTETGAFEGSLDPALAEALREGFAGGLYSVSFFGKPGIPVADAQERFKKYLEDHE